MMRGFAAILLGLTIAACGTNTQVFESSFGAIERDHLFSVSDVVVIARVKAEQPTQQRIGPDWIWTKYSMETIEVLKGHPIAVFMQPGGREGNTEQVFLDVVYVEPGETYLMFLDNSPIGSTAASQVIGAPAQVLFREIEPGVFENLEGSYRFTRTELQTLSQKSTGSK